MKIETLKERIEKKENQIEKKKNTIEKKRILITKKLNQSEKEKNKFEANYKISEAKWLEKDIERLEKEIKEAEETIEKYKEQLAGEIEKEEQFIKEVPEQVKEMERMLIEKWDISEKKRREWLAEEEKNFGYRAFIREHSRAEYEFIMATDEQIHKWNERDARVFVLDLLNRTKAITGEVTSWDEIRLEMGNSFPVLNGYVTGKEGRAKVESILAGGYNIQRMHVRVLVKEC